MPKIEINTFKGMIPKVSRKLISNENADYAVNCLLDAGKLEALNNTSAVAATLAAGHVKGLFLYQKTHWFSWNSAVKAIESPIAQDQYARIYYTGDGVPKVTSNLIATSSSPKPAASYTLGVPAPLTALTAAQTHSGSGTPGDVSDDELRVYVMTFVTGYGEEGAPGPVSTPLNCESPDAQVTLTLPTLASNPNNVTHKRIYRSATGANGTDFYFVAQVTLATTNYVDTKLTESLGTLIDTWDFLPPPAQLQGLTAMANGITVGFAGNELFFSPAYLPYAFPAAYRRTTQHKIVGVSATQNAIVVATEGYPYVFSGISPDAMSDNKIEEMQACVSARSMIDMGNYVIYASPDGLVAASEGGAQLVTKDLLNKRTWEAYKPATIHAYLYEKKYIAFYGDTNGNGVGTGGFMFDPDSGEFTLIDVYATAGFTDLLTDTLYLVVGGQLQAWLGAVTKKTFVWRSKPFTLPFIAFNCCKVECNTIAAVGMKLWVDGVEIFNYASLPADVFRLPENAIGKEWQFEFQGTGEIDRVVISTSMRDL